MPSTSRLTFPRASRHRRRNYSYMAPPALSLTAGISNCWASIHECRCAGAAGYPGARRRWRLSVAIRRSSSDPGVALGAASRTPPSSNIPSSAPNGICHRALAYKRISWPAAESARTPARRRQLTQTGRRRRLLNWNLGSFRPRWIANNVAEGDPRAVHRRRVLPDNRRTPGPMDGGLLDLGGPIAATGGVEIDGRSRRSVGRRRAVRTSKPVGGDPVWPVRGGHHGRRRSDGRCVRTSVAEVCVSPVDGTGRRGTTSPISMRWPRCGPQLKRRRPAGRRQRLQPAHPVDMRRLRRGVAPAGVRTAGDHHRGGRAGLDRPVCRPRPRSRARIAGRRHQQSRSAAVRWRPRQGVVVDLSETAEGRRRSSRQGSGRRRFDVAGKSSADERRLETMWFGWASGQTLGSLEGTSAPAATAAARRRRRRIRPVGGGEARCGPPNGPSPSPRGDGPEKSGLPAPEPMNSPKSIIPEAAPRRESSTWSQNVTLAAAVAYSKIPRWSSMPHARTDRALAGVRQRGLQTGADRRGP